MQLPLIHLNGTTKSRLLENACAACDAVRAAITTLQDTAPHGRDYYPLGAGAHERALAEYHSRHDRLSAVLGELEELALGISNAGT